MKSILSLYSQAFSNLQRNVWILAFAMFVNRSGAMVILFTSLYLTNELDFNLSDAGIAVSFFGLGSILGSFVGGWLTDRGNFFDIMVLSLFASGLVLPFLLMADTLVEVACVIFVYAFVADIFRPAMSKGIVFYSDARNRTRSVGLIRLAINLGFTVGPAIGGVIAFNFGYIPLIIADAATSILAGVLLMVYLPRKPVEHVESVAPQLRSETKSAYKDYFYLFFIFLVSLYALCFFQLFASIPQYLDKVWHYSEAHIGWFLGLNGALVVLIEMPMMLLLEKKEKIFHFIIVGSLCIPTAFTILFLGHGLIFWIIIYTLIITFSEMLCMPFMMNFSLSRPAKERQGEYSALYSMAYGIAHIGAPLLGLGIADKYGFDKMFYVLIVLSLFTAFGFVFLNWRLGRWVKSSE